MEINGQKITHYSDGYHKRKVYGARPVPHVHPMVTVEQHNLTAEQCVQVLVKCVGLDDVQWINIPRGWLRTDPLPEYYAMFGENIPQEKIDAALAEVPA